MLALLWAPMLIVAAAIRLDSPGPSLFRQDRVGLGGRTFVLYKFRTMRTDAPDDEHRQLVTSQLRGGRNGDGQLQKLVDDQRVTRLGQVLRRWSIDELPQLINVLRGDMSLVGPRPCLPWEAEMFSDEHRRRFAVQPGLTGLWQVSGRGGLTMHKALDLDVEYVDRRSVSLDLALLARTPAALLRSRRETA